MTSRGAGAGDAGAGVPASVGAGDARAGEGARELDHLLAETLARHFEGGVAEGAVARVGMGGVEVVCRVAEVRQMGRYLAASLFLRLSGGALGAEPVFASVSGYEATARDAVISGGCAWACAFGPVLRAGLAGVVDPDDEDLVRFETVLGGRRFRVAVSGMDRVFALREGIDSAARLRQARERLAGGGLLTPQVLGGGVLPVLPARRASVLSIFASQSAQGATVEVKVNGADWAPAHAVFPADAGPEGAMTLLRELAVLTPVDDVATLDRPTVTRTLAALAHRREPHQVAGWPGWRAAGTQLADPLTAAAVDELELTVGPLPGDYRRFLTTVAASGAGPGYGLLPPTRIDDVVPLAHAGCCVFWVLRLDSAGYGTVWVDAVGSDRGYRQVSASFTDWYTAWLDAAVRDRGPWLHWDRRACATTAALSQVLAAVEEETGETVDSLAGEVGPGGIALRAGRSRYRPEGAVLEPCHGCVTLAARFGLADDVFG